jgi:hypothetical protein
MEAEKDLNNPMFSSFMSALSRHAVSGGNSSSSVSASAATPAAVVPNLVTKFTNETNEWVEKTNAEIEQRNRNFLHESNPLVLMGITLVIIFVLSLLLLNGWKLCSSKGKGVLFAFLITFCLFGVQFVYYWNWIRNKKN